ncbi:hypothetical protein [Sulfuracidifex tepidarius]|uniref:Uncharacterized protein n=1 Tax=Sulfuracidifex tepidarius TaxID=1294262 RepID=A0A510E072_9CREN|nr:hypothetical protein [Sulfuracidifex tepidarius]BBG22813.1 hypothetical protein IC006_0097 [Sulfuracidifex tepidarius]BBG25590.1 hypothetical protein IC007_0095 [Sulfuracidifex tepidarius]
MANSLAKFLKSYEHIEELNPILSLPIKMIEPRKEEVVESLSTTLSPYDALHAYVVKRFRAIVIRGQRFR